MSVMGSRCRCVGVPHGGVRVDGAGHDPRGSIRGSGSVAGKVVWSAKGRSKETVRALADALVPERAEALPFGSCDDAPCSQRRRSGGAQATKARGGLCSPDVWLTSASRCTLTPSVKQARTIHHDREPIDATEPDQQPSRRPTTPRSVRCAQAPVGCRTRSLHRRADVVSTAAGPAPLATLNQSSSGSQRTSGGVHTELGDGEVPPGREGEHVASGQRAARVEARAVDPVDPAGGGGLVDRLKVP